MKNTDQKEKMKETEEKMIKKDLKKRKLEDEIRKIIRIKTRLRERTSEQIIFLVMISDDLRPSLYLQPL